MYSEPPAVAPAPASVEEIDYERVPLCIEMELEVGKCIGGTGNIYCIVRSLTIDEMRTLYPDVYTSTMQEAASGSEEGGREILDFIAEEIEDILLAVREDPKELLTLPDERNRKFEGTTGRGIRELPRMFFYELALIGETKKIAQRRERELGRAM